MPITDSLLSNLPVKSFSLLKMHFQYRKKLAGKDPLRRHRLCAVDATLGVLANGGGRLATSIRCARPGTSFFQSASPFGGAALAAIGGGVNWRGGAALNVPSFTAWKYAMTLALSASLGMATTIAEPGTTVVGEARKRSNVGPPR